MSVYRVGSSEMPGKHLKINKGNAADEAWLAGVLSLIPDSVYGRAKAKVVEESVKKPKKKKRKNKANKPLKAAQVPEKSAELQERLRSKISECRAERKADDSSLVDRRESRKRKRDEKKAKNAALNKKNRLTETAEKRKEEKKAAEAESKAAAEEHEEAPQTNIELSRIEGLDETEQPKKSKKRPRTKNMRLNELQTQLDDALEKRDADDEAVQENEIQKAMLRAKGAIVKDDVSKLRKTIRKEKRKSVKAKEDWAKRVEAVEDEKMAKQKKREENLKERRENNAVKGKAKQKNKGKGKMKSKK